MKPHTVFLRSGCILPDRFDLRQEPFCDGWTETLGAPVSEVDARIRKAGWHFMWITDSHTSRGLGSTPEIAIHRALVRALGRVKGRFNAAELESCEVTSCLGLRIARIELHTRHIQKQTSLDSAEETQLQEVLAH